MTVEPIRNKAKIKQMYYYLTVKTQSMDCYLSLA